MLSWCHTYPSLSQRNSHLRQVPLWALASPPHLLRVYYLLIQNSRLPNQGSSISFKTPTGPRTRMIFLYPISPSGEEKEPSGLWGPGLQAVIHFRSWQPWLWLSDIWRKLNILIRPLFSTGCPSGAAGLVGLLLDADSSC